MGKNLVSITASLLIEYIFCPRFLYFMVILDIPQREEKRFKVQKGREIHEVVRKRNPGYLRKKLGVIKKQSDVYLGAKGMRGIVDEILFLDDGTAAPLDYKYAEYKERIFKNHIFQLVFYGKLISENFHLPVNKGLIIYTRSKNKLMEVEITNKMYDNLEKIMAGMQKIITTGYYPKPTRYKARCRDCTYKNICEQGI